MIVGITGGIGSGKTICAKIFEELGVPVYYSDDRAKMLMIQDKLLIEKIKKLLGDEAYTSDGQLNKGFIAQCIFGNKELRNQMNAIVHPAVRDDFMRWGMEQLKSSKYVLQESALMYETGSYRWFDKIIVVDASEEIRIDRVLSRDKTTRESIVSRMNSQLPSSEKRAKADYIIENDGKQHIIPQIIEIHRQILGHCPPRD